LLAAETHNITDLRKYIEALDLGDQEGQLGRQLGKLVQHYNISEIRNLLKKTESTGERKSMADQFRVAFTADFHDANGNPQYKDFGLHLFDAHSDITVVPFSEHRPEIGADQIDSAQGIIVLTPSVTRQSLQAADNLLAIGRFGVGFDNVDVSACTDADVLAFITSGAVNHSVAEATIGWMLALSHNVLIKDRLIRIGAWDDRSAYMGSELRDRTFGAVGLGGIARKTIELLRGFGLKSFLAYDPFVDPGSLGETDIQLVDLQRLMESADFVSVHCPLTEDTRNLITARELGWMRPDAYLLNTARGGIINEDDLYECLKSNAIAGAAIDCFEGEPITEPNRFGEFDNVLLAPHCIAWTDEIFRDIGACVCQGMIDLSQGKPPQQGTLNPEVLEKDSFKDKWKRLQLT